MAGLDTGQLLGSLWNIKDTSLRSRSGKREYMVTSDVTLEGIN